MSGCSEMSSSIPRPSRRGLNDRRNTQDHERHHGGWFRTISRARRSVEFAR